MKGKKNSTTKATAAAQDKRQREAQERASMTQREKFEKAVAELEADGNEFDLAKSLHRVAKTSKNPD